MDSGSTVAGQSSAGMCHGAVPSGFLDGSSSWPGACLRARFADGGKRGGGDLRPLSRFPLPPGGERSSVRRLLRSPSLDRLPMGELRFTERLDDESEDASVELRLSL